MKKRNKVLLAAICINILNGVLFIWSSISKEMVLNWNWTSSQSSFPYTLHNIVVVITMLLFGWIKDKRGPQKITVFAGVFFSLGLILSSMTKNFYLISIFIGVFVGGAIGVQTVTTGPTAIKWFEESKRGTVNGLVTAGVGLSGIMYSYLGTYLIDNYGLSKNFLYIGIFASVGILLGFYIKNPEEEKDFPVSKFQEEYDWRYMLKDLKFYKLWILNCIYVAVGLLIVSHISMIGRIQAGIENVATLIMISSLAGVFGRFGGGLLSDKIGRINLIKIVALIQGVNILMFSKYTSLNLILMGVFISGFSYGVSTSVFPVIISDYYGLENYGFNYGILTTSQALGAIIGPQFGGFVFDKYGNYNLAFTILGVLSLMSLILRFDRNKKDAI